MGKRVPALLVLVWPVAAQQGLTLPEAVEQALKTHPALEASAAQRRAAEARVRQARSGYFPKLAWSESFQRSDNPVFVFGSLLTQRQFTESNFAIGSLNRPDFLNNFQSVASVEQTLWDAGETRSRTAAARLGGIAAGEDERRARQAAALRVVEAYFGVKVAESALSVAREAVKSAQADLDRAIAVREAGMSTDADVLSIRVHMAAVREQEIRRAADLDVARSALNEALGLPLDSKMELRTALERVTLPESGVAQFEAAAGEHRAEVRRARLSAEIAEQQASGARAALWPQIGARAVFETDRQEFIRRGGANWMLAASLRWNLFNGFADRARVAEASHALTAARAEERRAGNGVRLEVRRAWAALRAADERIQVAAASVAQAEESLRIIKNRYDTGLSTVTELLRNETAVLDTCTRLLAAIYEQRVAAAALEYAAGTLAGDSDVLK
ncbi:MAG TPA: TolC family protein [Bryobacteraceae bacterium]|nr:TolC family protein [Bryobacteraceae bacterium]